MKRWIALLRGINVGGNNILPMAQLARHFEAMELTNVRTYIQSGNVVFDAAFGSAKSIAQSLASRIEREHGFGPRILLLGVNDLQAAIDANPFADAVGDPKSVHFYFLEQRPKQPNLSALEALKATAERYALLDRVFYLHVPEGVGRSKLAASAEKHLAVAATARNYRTVEKLLAMALAD
jgi:uncharacterized protein (DUF1697 family)